MFNFQEIVSHMGPPAVAVASALILMAVTALAIFFERLYAYWRSQRANRAFVAEARRLIDADDTETLAAKAAELKASHLATLLGSGAKTYLESSKKQSALSPVEATRRELYRKTEALAADVRRGMSVLASVGSIAPFVGLLGTVFGIITAFQGIAKEGSGGLGSVSLGISEALYETALGLVVAIPAVLAYNWLSGKADGIILALEQARGEFLDHLEARHGKTAHGS
ncbi:MAG: MotA/TolQ/ExbB proton channel family protein [Myxococcota bacterium]|jgi:biopolymer transport protein ExbB